MNAGRQQSYDSILEMPDEEFDWIMKTNLYAPYYIIKALLPHLKPEQFIAEPAKRDTAPACALGTALVRNLDPDAVVVFLPAASE